MKKINIVNHTHWDREWYFTTMDSLVLSDQVFTEALDELENNKEAKFCLDGQSSILEEYLSIRPEKLETIKRFVNEGRLFIGPWYTQTDAQLVSGESIIRNLSMGINDISSIGTHMKVGYLPDTFGFNPQMPTILNTCDIDNIIFWRGINYDKHVKSPYFVWKAMSGEEVIAANLIDGYGSVPRLLTTDEFRNKKLFPLAKKISDKTELDEILIPIGNDQVEITNNLDEKINKTNKYSDDEYKQSSYEDFMKYLRDNKEKLETYEGEFREPKTGRVHKTIGSVRYDIKKMNYDVEQTLLNRIEPLYAIGKSLNIDISKKLIEKAWKLIMEGQAHDGMAGCITDKVSEDVLYRMRQAKEICDGLENLIKKRIAEGVGVKENEVIVFNTLPCEFTGYKVIEFMSSNKNVSLENVEDFTIISVEEFKERENILLEAPEGNIFINEPSYCKITALAKVELPPMGYKVFTIVDAKCNEVKEDNKLEIKNDNYTIFVDDNKLCVKLRNGKIVENLIEFENCGNDGDTYDFSPLRNDENILFNVTDGIKEISQNIERLILSGNYLLPKTLDDRISKENMEELQIKIEISLIKDNDMIQCKIIVDNNIDSHRLRVKIKSDIYTNESIASVPFGYIKRPILNGELGHWENDYLESPIDIEVFDSNVSITDDKFTMSVYSKGIKEYQVCDDTMYLTLFSTTGQLGKPDLLYRPGRASGDTTKQGHVMIPTPNAQLHGIKEFEFGVCLLEEKFDEHLIEKRYEKYTAQNINYQVQNLNKFINRIDNKIQKSMYQRQYEKEYSLLSIDDSVVFSSISPSLKDDAVLLRLKNSSNKTISLKDYNFDKFKKWEVVNNIERKIENQLEIDKYNMLTIKLYY